MAFANSSVWRPLNGSRFPENYTFNFLVTNSLKGPDTFEVNTRTNATLPETMIKTEPSSDPMTSSFHLTRDGVGPGSDFDGPQDHLSDAAVLLPKGPWVGFGRGRYIAVYQDPESQPIPLLKQESRAVDLLYKLLNPHGGDPRSWLLYFHQYSQLLRTESFRSFLFFGTRERIYECMRGIIRHFVSSPHYGEWYRENQILLSRTIPTIVCAWYTEIQAGKLKDNRILTALQAHDGDNLPLC